MDCLLSFPRKVKEDDPQAPDEDFALFAEEVAKLQKTIVLSE